MILRQVKESLSAKLGHDLVDYLRDHGNAINQLLRRWVMTTPTSITGNVNDYDPRDATVLRLTTSGSFALRGISQVHEGKILTIVNVGANDLVLANQHASATAVNRIITPDGSDITLTPNGAALFLYDIVSARWRAFHLGATSGGGGGAIDGSGAAGQVTFWLDADTITGDNSFFWDNAAKIFTALGWELGIDNLIDQDGYLRLSGIFGDILLDTSRHSWIDTGFNFGIGTNNPVTKLDVRGNGRISETFIAEQAFIQGNIVSNVTGLTIADASLQTVFFLTLQGNITLQIDNPSQGQSIELILIQDATGSRTIAWPIDVKLAGGAFVLTTTPDKADTITLRHDGTQWWETARTVNL